MSTDDYSMPGCVVPCTCKRWPRIDDHDKSCPVYGYYQAHIRATACATDPVERPEQVRGSTHGDYAQMSDRIQIIKDAMRSGSSWNKMGAPQREALDLIATKIGRIVCGDFSHYDHWDDVRGYAQLVLDRMIKPTGG